MPAGPFPPAILVVVVPQQIKCVYIVVIVWLGHHQCISHYSLTKINCKKTTTATASKKRKRCAKNVYFRICITRNLKFQLCERKLFWSRHLPTITTSSNTQSSNKLFLKFNSIKKKKHTNNNEIQNCLKSAKHELKPKKELLCSLTSLWYFANLVCKRSE